MEGQGFQVGQCIQECIQQGALLASPEQGLSRILVINAIIMGSVVLLMVWDALSRWRENVDHRKRK